MKKRLPTVTLFGLDCVDIDRLILAANICENGFEFGAVKLLSSLPSQDPRVIKIDPINSIEAYSEFMIRDLDRYVDTEYALIIQYDGFILNPDAWTDEYLAYDFIGAPWFTNDWFVEKKGIPKELLNTYVVGNGGFSLRSKKLTKICRELAADGTITKFDPEDIVICVHNRKLLESRGVTFAPIELAKKFSFESNDDQGIHWSDQFGFHGLKWTNISKWLTEHPEYPIINEMDNWSVRTEKRYKERHKV